jgi:hypothetical protein
MAKSTNKNYLSKSRGRETMTRLNFDYSILLLTGYAIYEFILRRYFRLEKKHPAWQYLSLVVCILISTFRYVSIDTILYPFIFVFVYAAIISFCALNKFRGNKTIEFFVIKNAIMFFVAFAFLLYCGNMSPAQWSDSLWNSLFGNWVVPVKKYALLCIGYAFVIDGGTNIVRGVMTRFPLLKKYASIAIKKERIAKGVEEEETKKETERAGELIGILERLLILTFVIAQNYEAVAFAVAAKSIARFSALDDKDFAEYYLIGTLLSVIVAVAVGLIIVATVN